MKTNNANCRFSLFEEIDKGLNHLVKEVLNQDGATKSVPPLAVFELAQSYVIECDLPGVNLEDVSLQVENGVLEISGHRRDVSHFVTQKGGLRRWFVVVRNR